MEATSWSLLNRASHNDPEALSQIIRLYTQPLHRYLTGVRKIAAQDADDIVQEFLVAKVLNITWLANADRERGRFRSYMFRSLQNFLIDQSRRAPNAVDGAAPFDYLSPSDEPEALPDEESFDLLWSEQVINHALEAAKSECYEKEQENYWYLFQLRVLGPATSTVEPKPFRDCAKLCGFSSASHASNALLTVERRLQRHARAYVACYCPQDQVDEEVHDLVHKLGNSNLIWARLAEHATGPTAGLSEFGAFLGLARRLDTMATPDRTRAYDDRRELFAHETSRRLSSEFSTIHEVVLLGNQLEALRLLKELAKHQLVEFTTGAAHDVWIAIYICTVWSAATRQKEKISSMDWPHLTDIRDSCLPQPWLGAEFRALLERDNPLR